MMFRPILKKCNGCEDSLPCQGPLKEVLLAAGDEVEAGRGNGPSGGAVHQVYR